jgi:hypothetical protein
VVHIFPKKSHTCQATRTPESTSALVSQIPAKYHTARYFTEAQKYQERKQRRNTEYQL